MRSGEVKIMIFGNTYTVNDIKAKSKITPLRYAFGHSNGFSGSPLGLKSIL